MKRYKVYFNDAGKCEYKKAIDEILGYSEEDALLRSGYSRKFVDTIFELKIIHILT